MLYFGEVPTGGHIDGVLDRRVICTCFAMFDRRTVGHVDKDLLTGSNLLVSITAKSIVHLQEGE